MGSITVIQFLGCLFQQNLATNTPRNQIVISQWCKATDETCLLRSFLCIIQFLGPMLANEMPTSTWRNRNASTFFYQMWWQSHRPWCHQTWQWEITHLVRWCSHSNFHLLWGFPGHVELQSKPFRVIWLCVLVHISNNIINNHQGQLLNQNVT